MDNEFELRVFGYAHEHEKQSLLNIPMSIKCLCLSYYALNEKFSQYGDKMWKF